MILSRAVFVACLLAVATGSSAPQQRNAAPPSARVVPTMSGGAPFVLQLPFATSHSIEHIVRQLASSVSAPVGLEYDESGPSGNAVVNGKRTVLTGLHLSDVLNLLADAGFTWHDLGPIVHISNLRNPTFLDTRVQSFSATDATFQVLLPRIYGLVDPRFPPPSEVGSGGSIGCGLSNNGCKQGLDVLDRKVSFAVENGTVRDVLDRAVLAHGEASWIVRYNDASGTYARSEILVSTFDGFTIQLAASGERHQ